MALPTTRFPLICPNEALQYKTYSIPPGVSNQTKLFLCVGAAVVHVLSSVKGQKAVLTMRADSG